MAMTISPADGFISRLLQQSRQTAPAKAPTTATSQGFKPDQTSISPEARQAIQGSNHQSMESRLLDLYNQKGSRNA